MIVVSVESVTASATSRVPSTAASRGGAPPERKRVHFSFPTCEKSGRMVFDLKGVHKAYGATRVFEGLGDVLGLRGIANVPLHELQHLVLILEHERVEGGFVALLHPAYQRNIARFSPHRLDDPRCALRYHAGYDRPTLR